MPRDVKVLMYCSFSFILGCTLTVGVIKFDNCSGKNTDTTVESMKLPRDNIYNFVAKETLSSYKNSSRKRILAFLFILVMSSPDNTEQRNTIRETWASQNIREDVQHFFFIGTKNLNDEQITSLVREYEKHKDLVLLAELADSYEALTAKVLMAFSWVANIAEFSFVLKCDDDTFVRVPHLVKILKESTKNRNESPNRLYWGFFDGRAHIRRNGQWAEKNWVICDRYLPYALGGGYVLSEDLVTLLSNRATELELFRSEDVAVGTWLSSVKGLERKHDPRFDTEYLSRGCNEAYVITHKKSPASMRAAFKSISDSGKLCPSGEFRTRISYNYNWNTLPSRCCIRNDTSVP